MENYRISVDYKLYTIDEHGNRTLEEETTQQEPFRFMSGMGMTLEAFEEQIAPLNVGDTFDFTIPMEKAYGEFVPERVIDLSKDMFYVNGKFDSQNVQVDALIPLQNEDGMRFLGHVLEIGDTTVRIDLNHPLAGKTLNFTGTVTEKIEADPHEVAAVAAHLSGEGGCGGCGGNCGSCGSCGDGGCGNCGESGCGEGGCGNCGK